MTYLKSNIKFFLILAILLGGCTKLDEEQFGSLSPSNYYQNEAEALSSVVGVYQLLSGVVHIGDPFRIAEFGTDEFLVPGRASGGWFDQYNIDIMQHKVTPDNATCGRAWRQIFQEIGTANAVLQSLESSPNKDNFKGVIAEVRALRAYGYFYAMDFWGNVPIFTEARVDPENLPSTNSRREVFEFVEKEMLAAVADLPSINTVNKTTYYPRLTKESVYAALATLYLNAGVYTGTPKWAETIAMSDNVINSGAFSLEQNVVENFKALNGGKTSETITAFSVNPSRNAGGNQFILYTQPALDRDKYNLPFIPANGYSTYQEALDRYEVQDKRRDLLEFGPQTYKDGTPLKNAKGEQLVLVPVKNYISAEDNEGYRVLKYVPDGVTWAGFNGDNDLVLIRYSDILLMKAEAQFRTGNSGDALTLVNQVRQRSGASTLSNLTLKNIEEERAREFIWEGHRRRDMIRFGSYFTETWTFKATQTPEWRGIYPIPAEQIAANPNLIQNPNY